MSILEKIQQLLNSHNAHYEIKEHPPSRTSEESAKYRGEPLNIGAKAILLKAKSGFFLAVFPAHKKLNTKKVKKMLKSKSLRFATVEELKEITELVPGAVPPFGQLFNISMYVDKEQFAEEKMAFNAGSLTTSIVMKTEDYRKVVQSETVDITV
jgi:Ala-tRNA(Pro) deacylase